MKMVGIIILTLAAITGCQRDKVAALEGKIAKLEADASVRQKTQAPTPPATSTHQAPINQKLGGAGKLLQMTSAEKEQEHCVLLYYLNGGSIDHQPVVDDMWKMIHSALKYSRDNGTSFGRTLVQFMGVSEQQYAADPWEARNQIDKILRLDAKN